MGRSGPGRWPTEEECLELLKRAGCSESVIRHLRLTEKIAAAIADRINSRGEGPSGPGKGRTGGGVSVDTGLVLAGALLHDIGRGRTHGVRHAIAGAELARELGLPEELQLIIERHIGAGIEQQEAVRMGLPPKDYIPLTLEEKIVAHADNLSGRIGKGRLRDVVEDLKRKGVPHIIPRMEALHRELSGLCGMDLDDMQLD